MIRIWKAIRSSRLAAKADQLGAANEHLSALETLRQAYNVLGLPLPSSAAPVDWNIIGCQICIGLDDGLLALDFINAAISKIEDGSSGYNGETRKYIEAFCRALQQYCMVGTGGRDPGIYDDFIDLARVSRYAKMRFKLPEGRSFL